VIVINGSKTLLGVSGRIIGNFSPTVAEMVAVCYGLEQAKLVCRDLGLEIGHVGICSDNQSVIDICVGDSKTDSLQMLKLLESIDKLCESIASVSFQWVRGHAANQYNKLADSIAYSILKG
jgi:ribonuclease HI